MNVLAELRNRFLLLGFSISSLSSSSSVADNSDKESGESNSTVNFLLLFRAGAFTTLVLVGS